MSMMGPLCESGLVPEDAASAKTGEDLLAMIMDDEKTKALFGAMDIDGVAAAGDGDEKDDAKKKDNEKKPTAFTPHKIDKLWTDEKAIKEKDNGMFSEHTQYPLLLSHLSRSHSLFLLHASSSFLHLGISNAIDRSCCCSFFIMIDE